MFRRRGEDATMRCSFCHKAENSVQKLISSPSDYPRAYICEECIAVCNSIIEDERAEDGVEAEPQESHPLLTHPLTPQFLAAVDAWVRKDSLGADASEEFAKVRAAAVRLVQSPGDNPPQ